MEFQYSSEAFPAQLPDTTTEERKQLVRRIVDVIVNHESQIVDYRKSLDPISLSEFDRPFDDSGYIETFNAPRRAKKLSTQYQKLRALLSLQKRCMKAGHKRVSELPSGEEYEEIIDELYRLKYGPDEDMAYGFIAPSEVLNACGLEETVENYNYIDKLGSHKAGSI